MTGGTRGLGWHAAEFLLRHDRTRHLLLIGRAGSVERVRGELSARTANPHVSAAACDLGSQRDIRAVAAAIGGRIDAGELPPLTGFLGNAGLQMTSTTESTVDGVEIAFAVNVLANYLLIRLLWDRFTAPSRIVLVGSDVHFGDLRHNLGMVPAPKWAEPGELAAARPGGVREGRRAYATSKLAVIYLVHALARRLPEGIDVFSYNPGLVPGTGLTRDASAITRWAMRSVVPVLHATPLAMSPIAAGKRLAETVIGPRPGPSGSYVDRGTAAASAPESYDEARADALWAGAGDLCGVNEPRP